MNKNKILIIFILIFLILLSSGNYYNQDYNAYKYIYEVNNGKTYLDIGFQILMKIFYIITKNYQIFVFFVIGLSFFILNKGLKKFYVSKGIYILYILYPFLYDYIQIRYLLAQSILILSMGYLKEKKKIKSICIFIVGCLIHKSIIIWIIYFYCYIKRVKLNKGIYLYYCLITLIIIFNKNILYKILISFIPNELIQQKLYIYMIKYQANLGGIYYNILIVINLFLVKSTFKYIKQDKKELVKLQKIVEALIVFCFLFLPILNFNTEFMRIIRTAIILYYCYYLYFIRVVNKKIRKRYILFGIIGYSLFYTININNLYLKLLLDLFNYNLFL